MSPSGPWQGIVLSSQKSFSGDWSGPPLKHVVKYLGAHLQSNLSLRAEVSKRIAAARTGFAKFSAFFKNSKIPQNHKNMVFRSVVNEALLSALEVRSLTSTDVQRLEAARGVLLRRCFGRRGFGAVGADDAPRSVPLSALRQQSLLADIASELRVRRLLWLRAALQAEQAGEVRLDLATLFGQLTFQPAAPVDASGELTEFAPTFLHILAADLRALLPEWSGFLPGWQHTFLATPRATIAKLPCLVEPTEAAEHRPARELGVNSSLPASPLVGDPSALAADFCTLQDGTSPQSLTDVPEPEWLAGAYCGECAAGPWHSRRSFSQHVVKRHKVRHPLKNTVCPQCRRQFTEVSACRRHLERQSCGSVVNNHGRAGAIAGGLEQARSAVLAQVHHPVPQANLPSSSRELDVRACFHGRGEREQSFPPTSAEASSGRPTSRSNWTQREFGTTSSAPHHSSAQLGQSCSAARPGHPRVRSVELPHLFAQRRQSASQGIADSNAGVEVQDANQRTPPIGSTAMDSGRHCGADLAERQ